MPKNCDDDICSVVDGTIFNDIIRAFLKIAVKNEGSDKETRNKVLVQLNGYLTKDSKNDACIVTAKELSVILQQMERVVP